MLTFRDGAVIPYPKSFPLDDAHLDRFCELYLRRVLNRTHSETIQPDFHKPIYQQLKAVRLLRGVTFNATVLEPGKLVLLYFFQSLAQDDKLGMVHHPFRQLDIAQEVNRVAEVIRDLKLPDVLIACFDLSADPNPLPREVLQESADV